MKNNYTTFFYHILKQSSMKMKAYLPTSRDIIRLCMLLCFIVGGNAIFASSHREAPLIANDPLADNTDLYAFRSPDKPNTITIIANYIPAEVAFGGPNYFSFG